MRHPVRSDAINGETAVGMGTCGRQGNPAVGMVGFAAVNFAALDIAGVCAAVVQSCMEKQAEAVALHKRVTLQTLARHLGLSTTTISVVVSNAPAAQGIPLKTRERILEAAEMLKYRPNYMARSLRGRRTMSIGILAPESEGPFARVMHGVEASLLQARYLYFKVSHDQRQQVIEEYARLLLERSVDGLLLIATPVPKDIGVPVVSIAGHNEVADGTNVALNHREAAMLALGHLRELGHTKIAFMKGLSFNADAEPRWQAIVEAARALGITIDPGLSVQLDLNAWSPCASYEPVRELMQRTRDFTAIFCNNDAAAAGAIRALHDEGVRVPEEVSVIGFGDVAGAAYGIPSLTTVRQPLEEMGRLAAATLLERIQHPGREFKTEITLQPSLVVRESTSAVVEFVRQGYREDAGLDLYGVAEEERATP
jgi:DNA-binding LacI/PurR family transcriptional regulator